MVISYCLWRHKCCRQEYFWVNPDVAGAAGTCTEPWQRFPLRIMMQIAGPRQGLAAKLSLISIHFAGGLINAVMAEDNTCWSGLYLTLSPRILIRINTAHHISSCASLLIPTDNKLCFQMGLICCVRLQKPPSAPHFLHVCASRRKMDPDSALNAKNGRSQASSH